MHRTYDTTGAYLTSPSLGGGKTKAFALDCIRPVVCRPKMLHLPTFRLDDEECYERCVVIEGKDGACSRFRHGAELVHSRPK